MPNKIRYFYFTMLMFLSGVFIAYCLMVGLLFIGWEKAIRKDTSVVRPNLTNFITVVIPVRNEASNIDIILQNLVLQTYQNFEIIVVDDHSDDDTFDRATKFSHAKLTVVKSWGAGKKMALQTGIESAKGVIVVTTDADCHFDSKWLESINLKFQSADTKFVFGGVKLEPHGNFFGKLQQLEFSSLIGSGVATFALGFATMCNGANIAFRKEVFFEVGGYQDHLHIPSGDDEFMMRKVATMYPEGIAFLSERTSVVSTNFVSSLRAFLHQRIRWAGKWRHHIDKKSSMLAVFILIVQLCTLATFMLISIGKTDILLVSTWLFKITIELLFLWRVNIFLSNQWNWLTFILLQLVYPFYVVFVGFFANGKSFEWKGRKLKSIHSKPMYP